MYYAIGASVSSLHKESTDSLISTIALNSLLEQSWFSIYADDILLHKLIETELGNGYVII